MSSVIQIKDLSVALNGTEILHEVTATILQGEFIGILGPNGAGKSTLVRCIVGLLKPTHGLIRVLDQPPHKATKRIGYLPQNRERLENIALSGRSLVAAVHHGNRWGWPWQSPQDKQAVQNVLDLAGATSVADRSFATLSGGERQRIRLAQALLGRPELLVLDEPLASLDPKHQFLLIKQVEKIRDQIAATVLFVAHDVNPLLHVIDRVLYVAGGKVAIGSLDEIITSEQLSALYGFPIKVIRSEGRVFVLTAEGNVTEYAQHA